MSTNPVPPPRPRIRATVPSRVVRAAKDLATEYGTSGETATRRIRDALTGRPLMALEQDNGLAAWAEQNDPQPPWWRRRARREWRNRWGLTP